MSQLLAALKRGPAYPVRDVRKGVPRNLIELPHLSKEERTKAWRKKANTAFTEFVRQMRPLDSEGISQFTISTGIDLPIRSSPSAAQRYVYEELSKTFKRVFVGGGFASHNVGRKNTFWDLDIYVLCTNLRVSGPVLDIKEVDTVMQIIRRTVRKLLIIVLTPENK